MKKTILSFLIAAAVISGCKKETVTGPTGPAGTNGINGNANVSSFTVTTNNWATIFDDGTDYWYEKTVAWAGITQDIKDKGVIMVYVDDGAGGWIALPYSVSLTDVSNSLNFYVSTGSVTIRVTGYDISFGSPGAFAYNGSVFRIVAIASSIRMQHPSINWNDYQEVKKVFDLKD